MTGEKIYEYDLDITGMTDYGMTLEAILSGQARVPPQGARIDVAFEGRAGGRLHRARDTRLDRTVAIKVLPAHLAETGA